MESQGNTSDFEHFCGGKFWDLELTWGGAEPHFTPCFQSTVVVWGPCAWLWLALIPYSVYLSRASGPVIQRNWKNNSKTVLSVLLCIIALADLIKAVVENSNRHVQPLNMVITPGILAGTLLLSAVLVQIERRKGFVTSGVLFIFWFALLIMEIVPFYNKILDARDNKGVINDLFRFITFYIFYGLLLVEFILSCIADDLPARTYSPEKECPEVRSSFLSRITFSWMNGLILLGYRKTLEENDIWDLNPRDITSNSSLALERAWQQELIDSGLGTKSKSGILIKRHTRNDSRHCNPSHNIPPNGQSTQRFGGEREPLLGAQAFEICGSSTVRVKEPSLTWVMTKAYGLTLLRSHVCKLVFDLLTFVGPILQSQLISFTEDNTMAEWKGYLFASLFFINGIVSSVFFHQHMHIGLTLGMRIKAAVITAVYRKALTLSNEARKDTTVGEVVNLMSVDAQRLLIANNYIWMVWSSPLQIIISLYMLWGILGPSALAGLAVIILLIPINGFLATKGRKLQNRQMKQKDQRLKLMNEVLNGIRVLKLYAWELSFQKKVNMIRNLELQTLKKYSYLSAVGTFTWTCAPFLVTLATFASFVLSGNELTAQKAFVSLSLFNIIRSPITQLPTLIAYLVTASVSIKRLSKFLCQGDIDFENVTHQQDSRYPISIKRGTFAWGTSVNDMPVLKNINLDIQDHELCAVVGPVGAGKSSILSALLCEMDKVSGYVNVRGAVAYVPQQAWIQNATLQENIIFGKVYNQEKYDKIIDACALKPDLEILPAGDMTEIGEKGINLSGGQKQRISLARAVYNDADVYLLDDPFSAVDAHVGKHIFEKVVGPNGLLKHKTRVLVTHSVQWLPHVDTILVMQDGDVSQKGSYEELLSCDGAFATFLKQYLTQEDSDSSDNDPEIAELKSKVLERIGSVAGDTSGTRSHTSHSENETHSDTGLRKRRLLRKKSKEKITLRLANEKVKKPGEKLIQGEKLEEGGVKKDVFIRYIKALGICLAIFLLTFFLLYQVASVLSNIWLSAWTENPILKNSSFLNTTEYSNTQNEYLGVYAGLGVLQALFAFMYAIISAVSMVRASGKLHADLLYNILRSGLAFFDTTPIGRILNRFSRDIETIDSALPSLLRLWMDSFFSVISSIIVISYSTPIFLTVVVPLFLIYYFIQRFYIPTSRQLKRIMSTTSSHIYTHFSETLSGASSIRAYGEQKRFKDLCEKHVDYNSGFYFYMVASMRWLGFHLEFLGSAMVFAAALFAVVSRNSISGGLVGLSLSYALQVTQALNAMVRMSANLETNTVSVERVIEYTDTPTEADWHNNDTKPPHDWPSQGEIAFENFKTQYREGLDLVLKGISANIRGSEKIGIVGRTGAGKSSLTLSLFRMIEPVGGSITIDGVNIANLGLHQLRSKLTILPQDPILFSGSLRMNLDPFDQFPDETLWAVLEQAHLKDFIESLPAKLSYECGEGGQNLSVGQRQLVCLGRTLLHKTKILVLDEATAAVDLETDELIQNTIKQEFADCTVLTIAHRINTIMDSDRVMVFDTGKLVEFEEPGVLLNNKQSIFYGMAKSAGLVS